MLSSHHVFTQAVFWLRDTAMQIGFGIMAASLILIQAMKLA